ncbi:MAG: class E sortase [Varibaculum sp.]|nr:class E sortase [Varibaculum sp.]
MSTAVSLGFEPRSAMREREPKKQSRRSRKFDFIAGFGELLITLGLLTALFAFWQVFVTDWQTASDRTAAISEFTELASDYPLKISDDERTTAPPVPARVGWNQTFGSLHVPKWNYMVIPVREGTDNAVIDFAVAGHYTETVMPGDIGNFSVAAHRRTYGSNFRRIDVLNEGDRVVVETQGAWMVYEMIGKEIVLPSQSEVVAPVPGKIDEKPTERLMTMTTCHPEYGSSHRYIVHLKLHHWVPRTSGVPRELAEGMGL